MKQPLILGLTGSIGMGKSTTAQMFADLGCAVWDADAAVHRLYGPRGGAVDILGRKFPKAVVNEGISREILKEYIVTDPDALAAIEAIVHPLVATDRREFIAQSRADIVVLDIPLLFEKSGQDAMDAVAVVSAPAAMQRERVLSRPGMTEAQFDLIMSRQMPDAEKRLRADYIIDTRTLDAARADVQHVVESLRRHDARNSS